MFLRMLLGSLLIISGLVGCSSKSKDTAAGGNAVYQVENLNSNYEYYSVNDNIFIGPQPSAENIKEFKSDKDVAVIINLRALKENKKVKFDPKAVSQSVGIKYYQVPVIKGGNPDKAAMEKVNAILQKHGDVKYLVHCSSGNRAAAWYATYAAMNGEMTTAQAMEAARKVGLQNKKMTTLLTTFWEKEGLTKSGEMPAPEASMAKAKKASDTEITDEMSEEMSEESGGDGEEAPLEGLDGGEASEDEAMSEDDPLGGSPFEEGEEQL